MSMFPHTITVYNVSIETDKDTLADKLTNHITILRGVLLDASKAVNVRESGLEGADAVNLYIPFSVDAVDGVTGKPKRYIPPLAFWRMEDKSDAWTLSVGGTKTPGVDGSTFFVKGEAVEPDQRVEVIEMMYDHVCDITKIDEKDFGGLPHFEVGAN
ncbi:hypothetical protein D1159_12630 [Pseudoflavonifractor sp. 524-17]|uniref:hypothetical protein n=1 Tax=Pseudoflavonifractor sp. 524-17 TaxID=2304577 RepID=UPI00137ABB18|nr:hypothetical protein [Pseudoflavonifractor sp. 524-17]NCE65399.1 hypothetical protein [Pseudoflavonifractor sp. 524-17]